MASKSWLPEAGGNLFQQIKATCAEAEARGQTLYRLSIGQPMGAALLSARRAAASSIMSDEQRVHEYQDNGSLGCLDFAKRFVQSHLADTADLSSSSQLGCSGFASVLSVVIVLPSFLCRRGQYGHDRCNCSKCE